MKKEGRASRFIDELENKMIDVAEKHGFGIGGGCRIHNKKAMTGVIDFAFQPMYKLTELHKLMLKSKIELEATYDKEADAAYIYFQTKDIKSAKTFDDGCFGDLIFDFAKNKKLIGIEILNASRYLTKEVLNSMLRIDTIKLVTPHGKKVQKKSKKRV